MHRKPIEFVAWVFMLAWAAAAAAQPEGRRPDTAALARGVNLSHWIWLSQGREGEARKGFITADELKRLRAAGMTHVRLPFEPERVWDHERGALKGDGLAELRHCVDLCLAADLAVVVDCHYINVQRTPWIAPDAEGRFSGLEKFWSALAKELASADPRRTFLEILNEPHDISDPKIWPAAQAHLVRAIRAAAPHHTIIATGDGYGSIDGLLRLEPLPDPNVVYSFHFYEPHNFTHQGASWGFPPWRHMKGLPYPATREQLDAAAAKIEDRQAAEAVRWSAGQGWNRGRLRSHIAQAADWGRRHNVPVYCGEFGVYAQFAPRDARIAWLRDTVELLAESGVGWAMWDYTGGFALAPGRPGGRVIDEEAARALKLPPPE